MRELIVQEFLRELQPYLSTIKTVAIVGGSESEPELTALQKKLSIEFDIYGIEAGCFFLDLNVQNHNVKNEYDLVICSQVLEHVWNVHEALKTLSNLTKENGLLWIGCPASNRSHGSPNYFSAGYQPEFIKNSLESFGLQTLFANRLGSERLYFMTHALRVWPNLNELKKPLINYDFSRQSGPLWINILRFVRDVPGRLFSLTYSSEINNNIEFATETFVLAKKT